MADLEGAAEAAVETVDQLSTRLGQAREALAALERQAAEVREQAAADWEELDAGARTLVGEAEGHAARLAEAGHEVEGACSALDQALATAGSEAAGDLVADSGTAATLAAHLAQGAAPLAEAAEQTAAQVRSLGERAAEIEAQLQEALGEARDFLRDELAAELREMREAVLSRAAELQAAIAEEGRLMLDEAYASWESELLQIEEILDRELEATLQHTADVVDFSLAECRQGHQQAGEEMAAAAATLDGLLQRLAEAVAERRGEVTEAGAAIEQALGDAAARVELMSGALRQELETMARYEFVQT
jgi:hypothetical protein